MVLIGIIGALSGIFIAPMAQSYSAGRRMLQTASASQFALSRLHQLMSRAAASSVIVESGRIDFDVYTGEETTQPMQVRYDSATEQLLLDGAPLLYDVAEYEVTYTADRVILNRITFNSAPNYPIDLAVYPRNQ